jgi:hypothetical protein
MAGRPALRIGQHGEVTRIYLGAAVWLVRCRYRDDDFLTRIVQRVGPSDEFDKRGRLAEDALIEALAECRPPSGLDAIGLDTLVMVLIDQHIARLAAEPSAGPVGHMPASAPGVCRAAGLHTLGVERCCRAGKRAVIEGPSPVHRNPTHGFTRRR